MLNTLFLKIFDMSFTAAAVILFVLLVRLILKKAPKIFSYALWGVVLLRLVCPISFESVISLLPFKTSFTPENITYSPIPKVDVGIDAVNDAINAVLPTPAAGAGVNPMQVIVHANSIVWLLGIAALLIYSAVSLLKLKKRLGDAVLVEDNVYVSASLDSPFVMGILRPKIYLPANLSDEEKRYILLHEQTHIMRFDHALKIISFLVLCLHWFNPLVWAAFFMSGEDMEMSCDEAVIKKIGSEIKKDYSSSLLTLATGRHTVGSTPLAFGEGDTKGRIKNVLNYKKPAYWVVIVSAIAIAAVTIGLLANPPTKQDGTKYIGVHATVLEIDYTKKTMLVKGTGPTDVIGDKCFVNCENAVVVAVANEEPSDWSFEMLSVDDIITIDIGAVQETYPTNTTASRIQLTPGDQVESSYPSVFTLFNKKGEVLKLVSLPDRSIATELAGLLLKGTDETKASITDLPVDADEYLRVSLGGLMEKIYYVYKAKGKYWVEKPNDYIRELEKDTYTTIMQYLQVPQEPPTIAAKPDETVNGSTQPLSALSNFPADYSAEQGEANGLFVVVNGSVYGKTIKVMEQFLADAKKNKAADIMIVQYTEEGDPIFVHLAYDTTGYQAISDSSRDKFGGVGSKKLRESSGKYLTVFSNNGVTGIYLTDKENLTLEQVQSDSEEYGLTEYIASYKN